MAAAFLLLSSAAAAADDRLLPPPERLDLQLDAWEELRADNKVHSFCTARLLNTTGDDRVDHDIVRLVRRALRPTDQLMPVTGRSGRQIAVPKSIKVSLFLDRQGMLSGCRVVEATGDDIGDAEICSRIQKRLKDRMQVRIPKPGVLLCDVGGCFAEQD